MIVEYTAAVLPWCDRWRASSRGGLFIPRHVRHFQSCVKRGCTLICKRAPGHAAYGAADESPKVRQHPLRLMDSGGESLKSVYDPCRAVLKEEPPPLLHEMRHTVNVSQIMQESLTPSTSGISFRRQGYAKRNKSMHNSASRALTTYPHFARIICEIPSASRSTMICPQSTRHKTKSGEYVPNTWL